MRGKKNSFARKILYIGIFILLIGGISYGYAKLQTTLTINGKAKIEKTTWDIHFVHRDDSNYATEGSFENNGENKVELDDENLNATYDITLTQPGQFYEFTLDIINEGTLDATLEKVTTEWPTIEDKYKDFITFTIEEIPSENSNLNVGETVSVKIKVEYSYENADADNLPEEDIELNGSIKFDYVQKKD